MRENKTVRTEMPAFSAGELETLKQFGRIKVKDIAKLRKYLPDDPSKPAFEWIFNKSASPVVLGDLDGFTVYPNEVIYFPRFFEPKQINSSIGIRNMIEQEIFEAVDDPTTVKMVDVTPLSETLPRGEMKVSDVINEPNQFLIDLKKVRKAEADHNKSLIPEGEE